MVIHHKDVVGEVGLLLGCRTDGGLNGAYPIAYRNDDGRFVGKRLLVETDTSGRGLQEGSDLFQMVGTCLLHFDLQGPIARIDIVELLLAGETGVPFNLRIEVFWDVDNGVEA